jgi:hypothetical protein
MTTPTLYHIKHPLSQKDLPEQTLATFTDQDIADYKAEFEVYKTHQHDAVREMSIIIDECRSRMVSIFGTSTDCKQVKYFDRMIRSGDTLTDVHANSYPRPNHVHESVVEARKKYCNFIGSDNAPKASGDDTLQEINNAVKFLMDRGMSLNSDFTISNAVSMAKTFVASDINDSILVNTDDDGYTGMNYNMVMANDGAEFPVSSFGYRASGVSQIALKCVDINMVKDDMDRSVRRVIDEGEFRYEVSFSNSCLPHLVIC